MLPGRKLAPLLCLVLIACSHPSVGSAAQGAVAPGREAPLRDAAPNAIARGSSTDEIESQAHVPLQLYGIRKTYEACVASKDRVQDREECSFEEGQFQDARLNRVYPALRSMLKQSSAGAEAALVKAQRAWLAFRDLDCDARSQRFGSDAAPATMSECYMLSTAMRAQQIEDWMAVLNNR